MVALEISIRDATNEDLGATSEIVNAESEEGVEVWRERFAEAVTDPRRCFLVATVDDNVVGFGQTRFILRDRGPGVEWPPDGWYLSGMTVTPTARRRGIGTLLTVARLNRLREHADCVYYVAEEENVAAIELHHNLGFSRIGTVRLPGHERDMVLEQLNFSVPDGP